MKAPLALFFLLLLLSLSKITDGQVIPGKYVEVGEPNSFCASHYDLRASGKYFFETGCEGRSNISFGRWRLEDSVLLLSAADFSDSFQLIQGVELLQKISDTTIIRILDCDGKNITKSQLLGFQIEGMDRLLYFDPHYFNMEKYGEGLSKWDDYYFTGEAIGITHGKLQAIHFPQMSKVFDHAYTVEVVNDHLLQIQLTLPASLLWGYKIDLAVPPNAVISYVWRAAYLLKDGVRLYQKEKL